VNWALAVCRPNSEPSVERSLTRHGFQFHIFRYRTKIIRLRKVVTVVRPIFPRYVFISIEHAWAATQIDNVIGLVCFGGELAKVSHVLVEGLIKSGIDDVIPIEDEPIVTTPRYRHGDHVVPIVGRLVGHAGRVRRSLACGRVRCEFDCNGKHIVADLPPLELCLLARPATKRRNRRYRRSVKEAAAHELTRSDGCV
jgi:transcriptional antiterminator RfaH